MKPLVLFCLPALLFAVDLSTLIQSAHDTNEQLHSAKLTADAKEKALNAQESDYFPTVDIGAAYNSVDDKTIMEPGATTSAYAKAGLDLFNGFRTKHQVAQKESEYVASRYDLGNTKRSLSLDIVTDFYNIKSAEAALTALEEKSKQLEADLTRMQKFKSAGLATQDDIDKLKAEFESNNYILESQALSIRSLYRYLSLKTGINAEHLDNASILTVENLVYTPSDTLLSLKSQADALASAAKATTSGYYPNIRVEDTYAYMDYARDNGIKAFGIERVEKQNTLSLTANMRLFDYAKASKQKQTIKLERQALLSQISHQEKQEKIRYELSLDALKTAQANIQSAQSAMVAAESTYKSIKAKFDAGIVDNVTYLDALSQKANTTALYQKSLNDLEIAKANCYYSAGKTIKEQIQ